MTSRDHLQPEELAWYLLSQYPEQEAQDIAAHLRSCALCQAELEATRESWGQVALSAPLYPLPTGARERFLQAIDQEARVKETAAPPARKVEAAAALPTPPRVFAWLGWAVAAAAVLTAVVLGHNQLVLQRTLAHDQALLAAGDAEQARTQALLRSLTAPSAIRVSLTEPTASVRPGASLIYAPRTGAMLLLASGLKPLAPGKAYELWLIPENGQAPKAAGVFHPGAGGGTNQLLATSLKDVRPKAFGITVEDAAGATTPTLPILLAGSPQP